MPATVISQPCPAVVSYIELYKPELIPYLAPVDSPLLHSARMIRAKYPEYANAKIVAITPCLAKKREFEDTGVIAYNVTFISVMAEIRKRGKELSDFKTAKFDGPAAERGSGYPVPGGLMRTVARENPEAARRTRTIEGTEQLYTYLDGLKGSITTGIAPLIVDCLNCPQGCIVGPGSRHQDLPLDLLKCLIEQRINERVGLGEYQRSQRENQNAVAGRT
jgi:iron only hydrogenase large subunit-like protein